VKRFTFVILVDVYKKLSSSPDIVSGCKRGEMSMKALAALFLASTVLAAPQQAHAWGGDGHRTVAAIAIKLLPPAKAAALDRLLHRSDVREGFIDAATTPTRSFASTTTLGNSLRGIT
jgi:hypothetical protein